MREYQTLIYQVLLNSVQQFEEQTQMERLHGILGNMRMEVLTQSLTFLWADMDL
jgi:hypothetical protein